jgi:hypothetical protein
MAITADHWAEWLDPRNRDVGQLCALMAPPADGSLNTYAVSKAVNNVKNNGPELLEPFARRELTNPLVDDESALERVDWLSSVPGEGVPAAEVRLEPARFQAAHVS